LVYLAVTSLFVTNQASILLTPSLTARQAAEAGLHKALYCLNATTGANCGGTAGGQFRGETAVIYADASFTTTVSGTGHGRHLESIGLVGAGERDTLTAEVTDLPPTAASTFAYALQAGAEGLSLGAKAVVTGNVLSAGGLTCPAGGATIIGEATVTKLDDLLAGCAVSRGLRRPVASAAAPTATAAALPEFDFTFWESAAVAGATKIGDFHPADGDHLGPLKIEGDLTIDEGITVRLDGPLWVTGAITVRRGARVMLNPAFGSYGTAMFAADPADPTAGRLVVEAGAVFTGSGTPGSRLLLVAAAASNDSSTTNLSGTPGEALFLAPHGLLRLADRTNTLAVAANRLVIGGRATVTYPPNTPPAAFAVSPGGTWRLQSDTWKEAP
jgi:hypothetical protein